ncbi:MAG: beta-lactamase family protein [Burkholderiales bacterium]|nr:beta-lactamase family protein [Burkholderiales bacterium]
MRAVGYRHIAFALSLLGAGCAFADNVDNIVDAEMKRRNIPGLSLVIIDGGKIVKSKGYGVTENGGGTPVTTSTLFQAGSISKPVAAIGALHLVEQGKLALDADVNTKLTSWKVPDSEFTTEKKVTLRGILSHSAGLTVHGFPGYASDARMPTVLQILNGEKPAKTAPIRVSVLPGSIFRYSGGGYTVMQQLTVDVTRTPFADFMREKVLLPLGMRDSDFAQPLTREKAAIAASGHLSGRNVVPGRWHTYPEMAAAGLWTTPTDLGRFAMGVQQSLAGTANPIISAAMTRQMLTLQKNMGLGFALEGTGKSQEFAHGGRDEGFDARLAATAETGQGAVVMINVNDNSRMMNRIMAAIRTTYKWPAAVTDARTPPKIVYADPNVLARVSGR